MRIKIILTLSAALLLLGCQSPEVKRSRGGGPGADLGYRGETVEMHAGSEPYYRTPQLIGTRVATAEGETKGEQQASNE
jgi:hypothetical protein